MARLELFLLGTPCLERDGVPLEFDTRKIPALVAYLAVSSLGEEGIRLSRDSLVALLWPDLEPSRARAVLRRNLSLLRSALEGEWLVVDRQTVGVDPEAEFWMHVDQFTRLVRAWEIHGHPQDQVCPRCLEALTEAAALYQADFLEGFGLRDSVEYDDWQFFQAEGLRQELASALLLADQGAGDRAVEVYACVSRYEFVANSRWFKDVAGRQLADVAASLPPDVVAAAKARGQDRDLGATARELLDDLAAWY